MLLVARKALYISRDDRGPIMSTRIEKLVSPGHDVVEKFASIVSLGILIAFVVKLGAIYPFVNSKLVSNAMIIAALVALLVPLLACIFTGPFWIHDVHRRIMVQLSISCFALASCIVYLVDMTTYGEWMGLPVVEQLGLHFVYSFYPVMAYLAAVFSSFLVSGSGLFTASLVPAEKSKNAVLIMALVLAGLPWLDIGVLGSYGPLWSLLLEIAMHGALVAVRSGELVEVTRNIAEATAAGAVEPALGLDDRKTLIRNGRNGLLHGVRSFFGSIVIFPLVLGTCVLLSNVLIKSNFIPLWLDFFPAFLATAVAWGFLYTATRSRFALLIASTGMLAITGGVLSSSPYALLDHAPLVTWFLAAVLSGVLLSGLLHLRSMAIGRFSQPFWGFTMSFWIGGGFMLAFLMKWDFLCTTCFVVVTYLSMIIACIIVAGRLLGIVPAFWNKGKRSLHARGVIPEYAPFTVRSMPAVETMAVPAPATAPPAPAPRATAPQRVSKGIVMLAVVVGLAFTCAFSAVRISTASTEHVLGSYGTDYYIWQADSLRNIDMNYRPDLPSSPVNSTARIEVARGEHEGFQVILSPWRLKSLNVMSLAPTGDLARVGSPTDIIGAGNITTFIVDYVPQLANQYPDRLLPWRAIDTSYALATTGRQNWPFYIDVGIPADNAIEPGTYRTTMQFYCRDYHGTPEDIPRAYVERTVSFTLEVHVFNFTVPVERHVATEIIWGIPETPAWHALYAEHRLDWYFAPRPATACNNTPGSLSITFDWTAYFTAVDAAFAGGMKYFPVTFNGIHPYAWNPLSPNNASKTVLSWYIGNLTAQLSNRTTPWGTTYLEHAYFFIQDEPAPEIYPQIISMAQFIHSISPNLKIMETMNNDLDTYPDSFLADIDIYCFHIHRWEPSSTLPDDGVAVGMPARIKTYLDTSYTGPRPKELWVYYTSDHFPTTDTDIYMQGILQRNSFWLQWSYGVPGWLYWTFNWGLDGEIGGYGYAYYGEGTLVGWGENGNPVGSLRLERVRDGIEDYEYFWLLNSTIAALDGSGQPAALAAAASARALLARVDDMYDQPGYLGKLPLAGAGGDEPRFRWSYEPMAAPYMQIRHDIGVLLGQIAALGVI